MTTDSGFGTVPVDVPSLAHAVAQVDERIGHSISGGPADSAGGHVERIDSGVEVLDERRKYLTRSAETTDIEEGEDDGECSETQEQGQSDHLP